MRLLRILYVLLALPYLLYGLWRFTFALFYSPRYVRNRPRIGLWSPWRYLAKDTWTEEGLRERNRMIIWQIGFWLLTAIGLLLWA